MLESIRPKGTPSEPEIVDIDPELKELIGPPPLYEGESPEMFELLWQKMRQHIQPRNIIEQIFVQDLVNLTWEIQRYRRFEAGIMEGASQNSLRHALAERVTEPDARRSLVANWAAGDPEAKNQVEKLLNEGGIHLRAIEARAFSNQLDTLERIDHLIARAEARRNDLLKEIDRHRESLGRRARQALETITDIEPELVDREVAS